MESKPNYTFVLSVRVFEVKVVSDGKEHEWTIIANGFADCVELVNKRMHDELQLSPFALKSIRGLPRTILTEKAIEALGNEIC